MKKWEKPYAQKITVRINENIAASGDDIRQIVLFDGTFRFRVNGNVIVDTTDCTFVSDGGTLKGKYQTTGSLFEWQVKGCRV